MFETLIVQPIFNLLLILYAIIGDFGLAIILFTVMVRFAMWPLLRRQLHQSKIMRELQPEIKKIRKKHKGDRQAESMAMMELYKEHGASPFGTFGLLLVQLPVFFGLFSALRSFISDPSRLIHLPYSYVKNNEAVQNIINSVADATTGAIQSLGDSAAAQQAVEMVNGLPVTPESLDMLSKDQLNQLFTQTLTTDSGGTVQQLVQGPFFDQHLFFIDLSGRAIEGASIYWPVMLIAVLAGVFQFLQTKMLMPKDPDAKSVREIMQEAARTGKEPDQSEVSAAVGRRMGVFFAPLITIISATAPAGLALYFATSAGVGIIQQRFVFRQDVEEMEEIADKSNSSSAKGGGGKKKNKNKNKNKSPKSNKKGG